MNIFYTNTDPILAANEHNSIHTRKMIVEYAQLLSFAHHALDGDRALQGIYKFSKSHKNHPSTIFTRSNKLAYVWVWKCAKRLCELYTADTGKVHKSEVILNKLKQTPVNIKVSDWRDPPVAAPDEYKKIAIFNGATKAYQAYLNCKFAEWQSRERPLKVEFRHTTPVWYRKL